MIYFGRELRNRGAWSGATAYIRDDVVTSGGSSYVCILAHTNQQPPNATYWEVLASKGDTGATGATGPTGATGATGATGPAPSGTGLVSVSAGVLDAPSTLRARVAADAANLRTDLGLGDSATRNVGTLAGTVAAGDDSRLSDARTPTSHTHPSSEITDFAEAVRDRVGSTLVAGSNVTITVDDPGDTITIAASGGSGAADMPVDAKSSNYTLVAGDKGKLISFTAGATASLTAAATLGSGWWAIVENAITGSDPASTVVIDPNSTEQIDGLTTVTQYVGERRLIQCNGTGFTSRILRAHRQIIYTSSGNYIVPPDNRGVDVEVIGGGGGGGGGLTGTAGSTRPGGSGGGGGANHNATITAANLGSPGTTITVTVGAQTSAASASSNGSTGNNSSFGSFASGYGGGPGSSFNGNRGGGSGGGVSGAGVVGINGNNGGGAPAVIGSSAAGYQQPGGGGATGSVGADGGFAEYGGGAGGGYTSTTTIYQGGGSQHGGAGGGAGGGVTSANAGVAAKDGGQTGPTAALAGSGGAAGTGTAGNPGTAGADGAGGNCGQGGGGGAPNTSGTGGAGGDGGAPGGGGGGGGGGTTGGAGGRGARGEVRVRGL